MTNINGAISSIQTKNIQAQYVYRPSAALLDIWKLLIANELIRQWQNVELDFEFENALNLLDRTNEHNLSTLLTNIQVKTQQIKQSSKLSENLEDSMSWLENYFFARVTTKLYSSGESWKVKNIESIKNLLSPNWSEAAPQKLTTFLADLLEILVEDKNNFEKQRILYLEQEVSAWKEYFQVKTQLIASGSVNLVDNQIDLEIMWRSIAQSFEAKLYAENFARLIYGTESLINLCQTYYDYALRSSQFLERVQKSLEKKITKDIVSLPVYIYCNTLDATQEKERIRHWMGHSIGYWGYAPVSWQQFEAKLLQNTEIIARKMFQDFYDRFIKI